MRQDLTGKLEHLGYQYHHKIDFPPVAIHKMQEKYRHLLDVKWQIMDAR